MAIDVEVSVTIAKPRADVAAYVVEPANEPAWISGIKQSQTEGGGPLAVGTRVKRRASMMGRGIDYTTVINEYEPGRRVQMTTEKPFPMIIDYAFDDAGGGTVFRQRLRGGPKGVMGLLSPLLARMVRGNVTKDMERLRAALEG